MTTTQTLSVTENSDINENTDDLIDKIFKDVRLMPVGQTDVTEQNVLSPTIDMETEPIVVTPVPVQRTNSSTDDVGHYFPLFLSYYSFFQF